MDHPDLHLPRRFVAWLAPFLAVFSHRTRPTSAALATGALLAVGPRTVTNCLRALGLAEQPGFAAFHRVLNRNAWSGLALARVLVRMVVATLVPSGPVIIGVDQTLERRRGPRIGLACRFYDPSLRADMPNPTSRGLRWLSAMVLVNVPFAGRIWALPVLTALTPSKSWAERHGRQHRSVTEWARLVLLALRRWLPDWDIVAVMDGEFAALELPHALRGRIVVITRMHKNARLFDTPPCQHEKPGRMPSKGTRQPLLSERLTDPTTRWHRIVQPSRTSWRTGGWIEYAHGTALWHHGGKPIVPILWAQLPKVPAAQRLEWQRRGWFATPMAGASRKRSCVRTWQLTVQTAGRQPRVGRNALAQVGLKPRDLADARRPRCVGWWLETTLDVASDGLAIQARPPGDGGEAQALPMQIQDHNELPEPDHPCSPPDCQEIGWSIARQCPTAPTSAARRRWGVFNLPIWGNYERRLQASTARSSGAARSSGSSPTRQPSPG